MNITVQTTQEVQITDTEVNRITAECLRDLLMKGEADPYDYIDIQYTGTKDSGTLIGITNTINGPKGTEIRKATELDIAIMLVLDNLYKDQV